MGEAIYDIATVSFLMGVLREDNFFAGEAVSLCPQFHLKSAEVRRCACQAPTHPRGWLVPADARVHRFVANWVNSVVLRTVHHCSYNVILVVLDEALQLAINENLSSDLLKIFDSRKIMRACTPLVYKIWSSSAHTAGISLFEGPDYLWKLTFAGLAIVIEWLWILSMRWRAGASRRFVLATIFCAQVAEIMIS